MDDEFRNDVDEKEDDDAPVVTDDEGNVVEPDGDEDPLKHGFTEMDGDEMMG